jgi:small subunit ribosomal protein S16
MLTIRMQRTGRRGHAQFRVVVQDSRFNPKSGRVVAYLGVYNPHTKTTSIDGEKIAKYLDNGAQPSDRVARVLQKEGIKLPSWVKTADPKERSTRHPEKRRSTAPKEEVQEQAAEPAAPAEEVPSEEAEAPKTEEQPAGSENSSEESA